MCNPKNLIGISKIIIVVRNNTPNLIQLAIGILTINRLQFYPKLMSSVKGIRKYYPKMMIVNAMNKASNSIHQDSDNQQIAE